MVCPNCGQGNPDVAKFCLACGNRNDVTQLLPLVERVPPVRGLVGRPRRRPDRVTADRGYDHDKYRRELRRRGIGSEIARRQTDHGPGRGRFRWVVERTFAWLHNLKRLLVRYDRRHEIHEAFLAIGCCLVCFRRLQRRPASGHCDGQAANGKERIERSRRAVDLTLMGS
jgi:transposase